jgi:hypothetical protein
MSDDFRRFVPMEGKVNLADMEDVVLGILIRFDANTGTLTAQQIWDDDVLAGEGEALCDKIVQTAFDLLDAHERATRLLS